MQAGVITLALTMLGGYVVYSQKSQALQQMSPGSKAGRIEVAGAGGTTNPAATNVFDTTLSLKSQPFHFTGPVYTGVPPAELSRMMMSGSKSARVVQTDAASAPAARPPATNNASRVIMPGSKAFFIRSPVTPQTSGAALTNQATQQPQISK